MGGRTQHRAVAADEQAAPRRRIRDGGDPRRRRRREAAMAEIHADGAELLGGDGHRKKKRGGDGPHPHSPKMGTSRRRAAAEVEIQGRKKIWILGGLISLILTLILALIRCY